MTLTQRLRDGKGEDREAREALFMCAASCQGGHSDAGLAASEVLGIPFPITMENLVKKAVSEGYDAKALWPWLFKYNDRSLALIASTQKE